MKPYYEGNHKGFEADSFLEAKIKELIEKFNIQWAIETGSYFGATTKKLGEMVFRVDSFEINYNNFNKAVETCKNVPRVFFHNISSERGLPGLLSSAVGHPMTDNILFYLDAHWLHYNPLLDELAIIADHKLKPVICVHDFKVPGHPELGYDSYGGQDYEWEWIKESVEKIYGVDGYNIEYNSEATGAKRGVIFITPKTY